MELMYTRLLNTENSSFFLFGVRGTGKSTWLRQNYSQAHFFDFLDEALYQKLLVAPHIFRDRLRVLPAGSWVVVDEIQRLPNLLNEVHRGIEEFKLNFVLTGSSARKLKQAGVNMLAGRARLRSMLPLLPQELGSDFNLEKILQWGSIPLIWNSQNPEETLQDYAQTYLKQEIQAEALVRNLAGFARSLPVAALYNGQVLNISSLARDAEVERKTAEGYIHILEDTLLIKRLYPYQANITVREKKKPKVYWVDPGLVRAAKGLRGGIAHEERGALLESYVFQILRHEIENTRRYHNIHYWAATESSIEVDFLLQNEEGWVAIEVKSSKIIKPEHMKGLRAIASFKGLQKRLLVYLGDDIQKTADGIDIIPLAHLPQLL